MLGQRGWSARPPPAELQALLDAVGATLSIILGILVIVYPSLLQWLVGIGLVLAGVALLASVFAAPRGTQ